VQGEDQLPVRGSNFNKRWWIGGLVLALLLGCTVIALAVRGAIRDRDRTIRLLTKHKKDLEQRLATELQQRDETIRRLEQQIAKLKAANAVYMPAAQSDPSSQLADLRRRYAVLEQEYQEAMQRLAEFQEAADTRRQRRRSPRRSPFIDNIRSRLEERMANATPEEAQAIADSLQHFERIAEIRQQMRDADEATRRALREQLAAEAQATREAFERLRVQRDQARRQEFNRLTRKLDKNLRKELREYIERNYLPRNPFGSPFPDVRRNRRR